MYWKLAPKLKLPPHRRDHTRGAKAPNVCVVGAVSWHIENELRQAIGDSTPPRACPEN